MRSIYFLSLNSIQFVPYAYGLLRSYIEQDAEMAAQYTWRAPFCKLVPVAEIVEGIKNPAILCASNYVWNHKHHAEIARRVKAKHPQCRVIFGGPHVPDDSRAYFNEHPYVDVLVHGEGEGPLKLLLRAYLEDAPDLNRIAGISFNQDHTAVKTKAGPQLPKSLPIPSPYLNGMFDAFLADGTAGKIGLWETNRGCPYACIYCDWGVRSTQKMRLHELDKIKREIDYLGQHRIEDLYIADSNFGLFERDLEIAHLLVKANQTYGYPKRIRINFAKKSNDTVFAVSKILHEHEMLWGTTLSMQSVDTDVLSAIKRSFLGLDAYKKLKDRYSSYGIHTYTELILGLPQETRESFMQGIGALFEIGIHDDIRVYELALLPNAPLSQPDERKKYGLLTKYKPLRMTRPGYVREEVELVFATSAMPYADWAYCMLFAEAIQALHNGGYTRFLAIYLNEQKKMAYKPFYDGLLQFMLHSDCDCFHSIKRMRRLIDDYYQDPDMPQIHRILTQPDIMEFLHVYNPRRKGWALWTYIWLSINEQLDDFYENLARFLVQEGLEIDAELADLLRYQKELMLTLQYDPAKGKHVEYRFNWFDVFFNDQPLKAKNERLHYTDTHMGVSRRFELAKNDRLKFINAAIDISYPSSKFRHFFHQPDQVRKD